LSIPMLMELDDSEDSDFPSSSLVPSLTDEEDMFEGNIFGNAGNDISPIGGGWCD